LSDLKGQYAGDVLGIINAENNLSGGIISLTQLLNIPYDANLTIDRDGISETVKMYDALPDEIYTAALQNLASVKATEYQVKSDAMAVKVANGGYFPTISLYGVLNTNYSSAAMLNNYLGYNEVASSDYVLLNNTKQPVITRQNNYSSQKIAYGSQLNNNLSSAVWCKHADTYF
jgi:outer membrane protein